MKDNSSIDYDISDNEFRSVIHLSEIGVDTETTGLDPLKDTLKLVQIAAGDKYFLIPISDQRKPNNLIALFSNPGIIKIFHHATFDVRFIQKYIGVRVNNLVCTKISSKILYGENHDNSLKGLLSEKFNICLDKGLAKSDWGKHELNAEQIEYAINDVKYLGSLWKILREELTNNEKIEYAQMCFGFVNTQAYLMNMGIQNIFSY